MRSVFQRTMGGQRGFTLVELLIAVTISIVLMGGVVAIFTTANTTYSGESIKAGAREDARAAFDMMVTELAMAGFDPTQSTNFTAFSISSPAVVNPTIQASQVRIFMDLPTNPTDVTTADGTITIGSNEDLTYGLVGMNLQRNGQTIIPNVTALSFTYRDANGANLGDANGAVTATATAANIMEIDVSMTVQASAPDPRSPPTAPRTASITLTSIVIPRNLLF